MSSPHWYCVSFLKQKERLAIQHLERQDYRVLCPRIQRTVTHARKRVTKYVPLFPAYLFVQLDISSQRWRPIDSTLGVSHIVKTAGLPARVDDKFMEKLVTAAGQDGLLAFDEDLKPGEKVRAVGGALHDQIGTLCRMKESDRVVVLMSLLGRQVEVTLEKSQLIRAA